MALIITLLKANPLKETVLNLPHTQTSLSRRKFARAKTGGKEKTDEMSAPLIFLFPWSPALRHQSLASVRKTKRLRPEQGAGA